MVSPAATPSSPWSVRTRTREIVKLARGLLSHETGTGGSSAIRCRVISIAAIFTGQRRSRSTGISGASAGGMGKSLSRAGRTQRILALWVDRGFGIAAWQPAYLFAVPAIAWAARRRVRHGGLLLSLVAVGWLVATFVAQTMHGWWWPGRQLVVILPAQILLLMQWIVRVPRLRNPFLVIGATGVVAYLVLAVEATMGRATLIFDFASTSNPLYRTWSRVLPDYLAPTTLTWFCTVYGSSSSPDCPPTAGKAILTGSAVSSRSR